MPAFESRKSMVLTKPILPAVVGCEGVVCAITDRLNNAAKTLTATTRKILILLTLLLKSYPKASKRRSHLKHNTQKMLLTIFNKPNS
jgi:hypothetical protein